MITNPNSSVEGVWRFNGTLEEEIAAQDFEIETTVPTYGNVTVFDFAQSKNVSRQGLKFVDGVSFNAGTNFNFKPSTYQCLISFWWYSSSALGQVRHTITKRLASKIAPIIAKANSSISDGIETVSNGEWIISEVGVSSTQNAIQVAVCSSGTSPDYIFQSEPYLPGLHHVGFAYIPNGDGNDIVTLIIDGKPGVYHIGGSSITVAAPTSLRINDIGYGYTAHKTTQVGGVILDLVAIASSSVGDTPFKPLTAMRFGLEYIVESDKTGNIPTFNGFAFRQPSTVTTTNVFKSGENIIVSRSNGELLSGARPIWDTVMTFKNPQSVLKLNTGTIDDCPDDGTFDETKKTVCWTENGLRIQGATVRI